MAASILSIAANTASAGVVRTEAGLLEGTAEDGLAVYRGVPFAAAPVGELRWRAPQSAPHWSGVRRAHDFAPSCMQELRPNPSIGNTRPRTSEDCLYLNVWSPARMAHDAMPVMVWIYGGGFVFGSTAVPLYSGEELAKHGVIVVSIAYRLGAFGFLAHPDLSAESPHHVSGNYGLLDQIAALQWVQKNIAAFGGDARRVTIFGESAGGISVSMLAASPLARGLFAGAISESGASFGSVRVPPLPGENMPALADAERTGIAFARQLDVKSAADLRNLPAETVQAAKSSIGDFWPTLDHWVILDDQYKLYQNGHYDQTPILIGTNSNEGAIFGTPASASDFVSAVHARFGPFAEDLLNVYSPTETHWRQSSMDLNRDAAFGWHAWTWARLQSVSGKSKAFLYYFDQAPPRAPQSPYSGAAGAVHAEELIYVFQHINRSDLTWSTQDRAISSAMAEYWTNFVKRGDPNATGLPRWPAFSVDDARVMYFDDYPRAEPVPNQEKLDILDKYFAWRRTPAGEEWVRRPRQ
jgi:para-nitrobenzyl esterase